MNANNKIVFIGSGVRADALAKVVDLHSHLTRIKLASGIKALEAEQYSIIKDASLVFICMEDYAIAGAIMGQLGQSLQGKHIINLTSGDVEQSRTIADEVISVGALYLDGALMAHPEHVGTDNALIVFSGDKTVYDHTNHIIKHFGVLKYLGEDAGLASLYDSAMLNLAWATLIGFMQTSAILATASVSAQDFAPVATRWLETTVSHVIHDYAKQIDEESYPGEEEWLELDYPLMDYLIDLSKSRGLSAQLPELIKQLTKDGIDAGYGTNSFASITEIIRRPGVSKAL